MTAAKKPADKLPVSTFTEAYPYLRRPFTPAAVRFKIQSTWEGGAMCITYIDARLVAGRLNMVCPEIWEPEKFEPHPSGGLVCHLNVGGIVRADYGFVSHQDADIGVKGTFSDALKRAAVQFGVGESLYVLPKMIVREGQHLKKNKRGKYLLTDHGEGHLRNRYKLWLEQGGIKAFGDPLDHGDTEFETVEQVEEPVEPERELTGLEALAAAADKAGMPSSKRTIVGTWLHPDGELDEARLAEALERIGAGDVDGLMDEINPEPVPA